MWTDRYSNHLAMPLIEDQYVTNSNKMTRNRDGQLISTGHPRALIRKGWVAISINLGGMIGTLVIVIATKVWGFRSLLVIVVTCSLGSGTTRKYLWLL